MTAQDRPMDTRPTSHRVGQERPAWRRYVARLSGGRAWHIAIAVGIAVVTVTVPPLVARGSRHGSPGQAPAAATASRSATPAAPVTTPSASPSGDADELLSRGRPATASSVEMPTTPASAAVDGSLYTRWSSAFSDPQWLRIDLGSVAAISKVVLQWDPSYAKAYQIQTSHDGQTWTTVYLTNHGGGGTETIALSGTGRFIRMYATERSTQWGYSLWEFEVYGSRTVSGCDTGGNQALNQPASASSLEKGVFLASWAVDGDPRSRWSSNPSDPQWIEVDLGTSQHICQVVLAWETSYAVAYQIQVSDDDAQWTTIYSTAASTGGTQTLDVAGTGRYLRIYCTKRATVYGYSLWEIAVHTATP